MGIFDWLSGRASGLEVLGDKIWLTKQAKFAGIGRAVKDCFAARYPPMAVILVAHFPSCLGELKKLGPFNDPVTTTLADELRSGPVQRVALRHDETVDVLVAQRHPLPQHDERMLEFARSLPCRCRLGYHVALDDPVMQVFAGEWVEKMLRQLGMDEFEAIQSRMISRRVTAAQQQLASRITSDLPADSAEEWMQLNYRPT